MQSDEEGFLRPAVDEKTCIHCKKCQITCPVLQSHTKQHSETIAFAAINKNEDVRSKSTSGGVFSLLAEWIIDNNGVVFGAAYADSYEVKHICIDKIEDLSKIRGAKYTQSNLANTYETVRKHLNDGRGVLFSGTPCQIAGLTSFLGKDYSNLLLVDLICHGVPSPKVWKHYIKHRSVNDADGKEPCSINLRSKETGWASYTIRFDYPHMSSYTAKNSEDPYLRGFVKNLYLRTSCYECHFKGVTRQSDFTLGDYWGVWNQLPEFDDGRGTSLVLLHSPKARRIWSKISANLHSKQVDPLQALTENISALQSSELTNKRAEFFSHYEKADFGALIDELAPLERMIQIPWYCKLLCFLRKCVQRLF